MSFYDHMFQSGMLFTYPWPCRETNLKIKFLLGVVDENLNGGKNNPYTQLSQEKEIFSTCTYISAMKMSISILNSQLL